MLCILETKGLPDLTTLVECCSKPTRESISRFVTFSFLTMWLTESGFRTAYLLEAVPPCAGCPRPFPKSCTPWWALQLLQIQRYAKLWAYLLDGIGITQAYMCSSRGVPLWGSHQDNRELETHLSAPLSKTGGLPKHWRASAQTISQMVGKCQYIFDHFIAWLRCDDRLNKLAEGEKHSWCQT